MSTPQPSVPAARSARRQAHPGPVRRILRVVLALIASLIAFLAGSIVLGAWIPAIPKAGVIGPVLGGQYPFHIALLALVGLGLGVLAWRSGLVRWGRTLTALTAVSAAFALAIGAVQYATAGKEHTRISFGEVITQLAYPGAVPDDSPTYAERDGEKLKADLYLPKAAQNRSGKVPAIVLAHAGGFHTFDKSDLRGTARWLADHGVAAIAIDYRLARPDRPTWDKAPQDLVTALRWTEDHAGHYGIDPNRISLGGMSAGGTLALDAAWRLKNGTIKAGDGRAPKPPHSVVGFYPGTDVTDMWQRDVAGSRQAAELFTGGTPEQHPDRYRAVSPTTHVTAGLQPTLLVVGDRDRSATPTTIDDLADALCAKGVETTVKKLPFAEHAFDDAYGSLTSQTSRQILLDFLTR
ncbi:alpha/beta hydrolase [Streptomyces sp. PKU-EA00015]|uniref:alpha/beta hydrolase n=1 Tax=Streptomyces sp. PKU-EA00015 TaxID=2748326 RepID=UPI0015A46BC7|nr:alpha/beta hydrolase [Streptomyces sp. PKU-EA00015]NWF24733.1 alpha/beta hydrolase [Streptomyces sp. PKU-EA00015]